MPFARKYRLIDTVSLDPQQVTDVQFFDTNGQRVKVTDSAKPASTPAKLILKVEATHSGINKNYGNYLPDKMQASAHTWIANGTPGSYNKPVIMNHNSAGDCGLDASDPIGRVENQEFKVSALDSSKHTIELTLGITDKVAIEKFLDGRYQTFSIGAYTDSIICSICGNDIVNSERDCGHYRGRKYDKKTKGQDDSGNETETVTKETCIWTFGNFEYDEISVVNSPADPLAVTLDIQVVDDIAATDWLKARANTGEAGEMPEQTDSLDAEMLQILDSIDNTLNTGHNHNGASGEQATGHVEDNIKMPNGTSVPPVATEDGQAQDSGISHTFKTLDDVLGYVRAGKPCSLLSKDGFKNMLHVINDAHKTYLTDMATLATTQAELEATKTELAGAQTALTEAKNAIDANAITHKALVDQNLALSKLVQSNLIDQLVMIRTVKDASLNSETIKTELKTLSTKRLYELIKEESANLKVTQRPTQLENPGLSDSNGNDAENPGTNKPKALDETEVLIGAAIGFLMNPAAAGASN